MHDEKPEDEDLAEWIGARVALAMVQAGNGFGPATMSICKRAYVGLVPSRARLFIKGGPSGRSQGSDPSEKEYVDIPREFWWAEGHEALDANWECGDFSTIVNDTYEWKAFGVEFERTAIESMLVRHTPAESLSTSSSLNAYAHRSVADDGALSHVVKRGKVGRPLTHDHLYAAARAALELDKLDQKKRDSLTQASVGAQLEVHYRNRHNSGGAPDADSMLDYAKSLLAALREHWETERAD